MQRTDALFVIFIVDCAYILYILLYSLSSYSAKFIRVRLQIRYLFYAIRYDTVDSRALKS